LFLFIKKQWHDALRISYVFLSGLLIAIPYGLNIYQASTYSTYQEVSQRFALVDTRAPIFIGMTIIAAIIFFILFYSKEDKQKYSFSLALLVTPFLTMNQQLITGKAMQAAHYHWYFHKPIAAILGLLTLFYLLEKKQATFFKLMSTLIIVTVSISVGIFTQISSYYLGYEDGGVKIIERQKYGPLVDWLNENARKDSVVFANDEISHMAVIYTPLNVFYHRAGYASLAASRERLLNGLFTFYRLRGISAENSRQVFFQEKDYISTNLYGLYYRNADGSYGIPEEKMKDLVSEYDKTFSNSTSEWVKEIWKKYDVEYVVWDRTTDPSWQIDKYEFLEEQIKLGDISVFQITDGI
jgi:hypothetical protein